MLNPNGKSRVRRSRGYERVTKVLRKSERGISSTFAFTVNERLVSGATGCCARRSRSPHARRNRACITLTARGESPPEATLNQIVSCVGVPIRRSFSAFQNYRGLFHRSSQTQGGVPPIVFSFVRKLKAPALSREPAGATTPRRFE